MYVEKKIKFSILIKYYCFFFYGWGSLHTEPKDNGALKFSEELPLGILATLPSTHKLSS